MNARAAVALGLAVALALAAPACSSPGFPRRTPRTATGRTAEDLAGLGESSGVRNLGEVSPGLLRGAQPEGDAAFALLADLGVKTILSVDGSRPDAEAAARHGIRTIHIPIEYAGISRGEEVKIAAAARAADGNLFVHCHHGRHRGPAACAVAWMTLDGARPEQAAAMMKAAGTDPAYAGLYRDVLAFRPVPVEESDRVPAADLPPAARVPDLVESMVRIDGGFARMKAVKAAGWRTPADMPDVTPAHEARILAERFREAGRLREAAEKPADFQGWRSDAEEGAWALEAALKAGDGAAAAKALDRVGADCAACHAKYRNR